MTGGGGGGRNEIWQATLCTRLGDSSRKGPGSAEMAGQVPACLKAAVRETGVSRREEARLPAARRQRRRPQGAANGAY